MTKTVYILTQEGRGYTDKGLERVRNEIYDIYNDDSDFLFIAGKFLNDPEKLADRLERNTDGYLILSMEEGIYYFNARFFPAIVDMMRQDKPENTWNALYKCFKNASKRWFEEKE